SPVWIWILEGSRLVPYRSCWLRRTSLPNSMRFVPVAAIEGISLTACRIRKRPSCWEKKRLMNRGAELVFIMLNRNLIMKKSRIQKLKNKRENSPKDAPQRQVITRQDMDRMIFDMVMSEIYENSDVNELLYDEILSKYRVQLPEKEKQRLWDVL